MPFPLLKNDGLRENSSRDLWLTPSFPMSKHFDEVFDETRRRRGHSHVAGVWPERGTAMILSGIWNFDLKYALGLTPD